MKTILKNCRLLGTSHDKTMLHDIFVKDGVIEKIGLNLEEEGAKVLNVGGHMVMPGLIDMHIHGYLGEDTCDAKPDGIKKMAYGVAENGVTALKKKVINCNLNVLIKPYFLIRLFDYT